MYEQHWNLAAKPFDNGPDAKFYFPAETHEGALLKLRYAVENRRGSALLAGGAGLGKTLLAIKLFELLNEETFAPKVHVVFPDMPAEQLVCHLTTEITGKSIACGSVHLAIGELQKFLATNSSEGRHAVIAVDEAHLLADRERLETLRLMMNFQTAGVHDLTLLLLAQPRMLRTIDRANGLEERLAAKVLLRPLSASDTQRYIAHRLQLVGCDQEVFTPAATERIQAIAQGVPRRINRLADLSLLVSYAQERDVVGPDEVDKVAVEMFSISEGRIAA